MNSNDGFPMVPLIVNIVHKCVRVIKWHMFNTKHKDLRLYLKTMK